MLFSRKKCRTKNAEQKMQGEQAKEKNKENKSEENT